MQPDVLADIIVHAVKQATAPLQERIAIIEAELRTSQLAVTASTVRDLSQDVACLRERAAVLETKAPIPGPAGKDGADGLGFDDLQIDHDGERTLTFRLQRDDQVKAYAVQLATMIYRGVYLPGVTYTAGDVVTHSGSAWHCQKHTVTRPESPEGQSFWRLMVKRGDRGKDVRDQEASAPARMVKAG